MNSRVTFNHNPLLEHGMPAWRPRLVLALVALGSLALLVRAAYLQGFNYDFLQAKGEMRYQRELSIPFTRGRITDRNGEVLAISTPVRSVWALPADARDMKPESVRVLSTLIGVSVEDINKRLAADSEFAYLKRQPSPDVAQQVAELELPGIHFLDEFRRYYPSGDVTSHVLGFTSIDDRGQEGVELTYDKRLTGETGSRRVIRDNRGQIIEDVDSVRPPRNGEDLALAIDAKVQYVAFNAVTEAVKEHKAKAGAAVVLDARTGEVLAMVNAPTFNPNNRIGLSGDQLRNRALIDTFEPGSTIKPFIITAALDRGLVRPNTVINTSNGRMTIGRYTISDSSRRPTMTVSQVVQKSSNIGTLRIAQRFSDRDMWALYDALGFGRKLELGFPGEASGRLQPVRWREVEQATMSYGYGISVSLMQMAHAYTALTSDGVLRPLSLTRLDGAPPEGVQVFSAKAAREMRVMLEAAAGPGGTARRAQVPGYSVAGKTGTTRKAAGGGYSSDYIASFVGFVPAHEPEVVIAVMIDTPGTGQYYGGLVAGPVFARIAEGSMRALGVAPDLPIEATPLKMVDGAANATTRGGR